MQIEYIIPLLELVGRVVAETFTSSLFIFIYLILFIIILWQYKRLDDLSAKMIATEKRIFLGSAVVSTLLGLVGGLLGSAILIIVGIDLASIGIAYLWLIALVLMLFSPRFLCFAYAGGILAIISLLIGYPRINIPQLMGLIAILHMVESLLIVLSGHLNPVPVYIKKAGYLRGGFNLQKFWPIPLLAMVGTGYDPTAGSLLMPEWWPLVGRQANEVVVFAILPVLAILGYGEVTTTATPENRAKKSAGYLFLYSLTLLFLAIIADKHSQLVILPTLFSPLGHELVIWLGIREEVNKRPIYTKPPLGIMVLDLVPGSVAKKAGIKSLDVLFSIDGEVFSGLDQMNNLLKNKKGPITVGIMRQGQELDIILDYYEQHHLGIIPVPEHNSPSYLHWPEDTLFHRVRGIWRRSRNWLANRWG
ncbi:MAG: PDZ domain-containing protein [Syntrophomonadaceae bacterium]